MKKFNLSFVIIAFVITTVLAAMTACSFDVNGGGGESPKNNTQTVANQKIIFKDNDKPAQSNAAEPQTKQENIITVFDGRETERTGNEGTAADAEVVNREFKRSEAAILSKTEMKCSSDDGKVSIIDSAEGSFTKPNAAQKIFLYESCRPGRTFGIGGILVTENGKAVAHYSYGDNGLSMGLKALPDIDKDGLSEIVMIDGGSGQGYSGVSVYFYEIKDGELEHIGKESVYSSNSGAVEDDKDVKIEAAKITVQPAANPVFFRETYEQKGNSQKWTLFKKAEKFTLGKGEPMKYNKIS